MAVSVEESSSSTPESLNKVSTSWTNSSSPMFSPTSDKRFWSALHSRIGTLLENRKPIDDHDQSFPAKLSAGESDRAKRMKEDSLLLLRGFDSVAHSLSQLSNNLDNALQGARDLSRPPTLTEIYKSAMEKTKSNEKEPEKSEEEEEEEEESDEDKRGVKRKFEEQGDDDSLQENEKKSPKEDGKLNKAKNLAISMATKANSLARELKSIKSDLCFAQERCAILEEENRRLRDGFSKGIRPEEDDLVRLQLEALLFEKSRLANENANLTRENQCLHQLVEYHQLTSQDLSPTPSYEHVVRGMCLDFLSPPPAIPEEEEEEREGEDGNEVPRLPQRDFLELCNSVGEFYDEEQQHEVQEDF